MMTALVVFGLATWRMASLLANETGPFDLFLKVREFFGIIHDQDKEVLSVPEKFLPQALSCVWCNSIYIGAFWILTYYLTGEYALWLALLFAVSAVAIVVEERIK